MELKREQSIFAHRLSNIDFFFLSNLIMWRMMMMIICTQEKSIISLFVSIILVNNLFSILIYVASLY